jgi:predicted ester cyclase
MNYRWVLTLALLVSLSLTACQPIQPVAATSNTALATETSLEEANKAVVQRIYEEAFNQKNIGFIAEVMDLPNLAIHELDYGADGLDHALFLAAFPDLQATVDLWMAEDDMVMTLVTFSGTHQGEFLGVAPTGKPMTISLVDIFRFEDGKVVELWHYVPVADILEQIGEPAQTAVPASELSALEAASDSK